MPLITESHDSLPYIDPDPTPSTRAQIASLLLSDLPPTHLTTPHPSLPPLRPSNFSPLILAELARIEANQPLLAIDTSRYEAPSAPSPPRDSPHADLLAAWTSTLQKAYASSSYLSLRRQNLGLLERFGRNAWVVGNERLEELLRGLEREVEGVRGEVEVVNRERRGGQEGVRGEVEGLEAAWREGVGRVVEVEVGGRAVAREVLGRRREGGR